MKILKTIAFTILMLTFGGILNAQNSDFINWETTAKDASGQLIINQTINVQIALHFGTSTTMASYIENHTPTTDGNGKFQIQVGNGIPVAGLFADLSWGSQESFIKLSINGAAAGTEGISKPRNLNRFVNSTVRTNRAKTRSNSKGTQMNPDILPVFQINVGTNTLKAGNGISFTGKKPVYTISVEEVSITAGEGIEIVGSYPDYTIELKKHFVGEEYLGGIVFYVEDNGQHGLIAGRYYSSSTWTTFCWESMHVSKITPGKFKSLHNIQSDIGAGWFNTMKMIMNDDLSQNVIDVGEPSGSISFLARHEFPKWYVPSYDELRLIYEQRAVLSSKLNLSDRRHIFWSSTEGGYIWKGHSDGPDGRNYGGNIAGYSGVSVNLGGEGSKVLGVRCLNFYTGKEACIAKTYDNPFILIRKF